MKWCFTFSFLILYLFVFAQIQKTDSIYSIALAFRPATVEIISDTGYISKVRINNNTKVTYTNITPGKYTIEISGEGQTTKTIDSIIIEKGKQLVIQFEINGPCLYDHPKDYIPICPKKRKRQIVPIIYGLVIENGNTYISNKKKMKVKYAGCSTSGCDPQFYCTKHNIEF